jgi:hypothetical protein
VRYTHEDMGVSRSSQALDALLKEENSPEAQAISDPKISGIHRTVLWRYRTGRRKPDLVPAAKLEKLSNGRVPITGWEDIDPNAPLQEDDDVDLVDATQALEPTPADSPVAKKSSRPPPPEELIDAVDLASEGTPTDVSIEPLPEKTPSPPLPVVKGSERNVRTDTNPETVDAKELPPLHVEAHPELDSGKGRTRRGRIDSPPKGVG